MAIDVFILEGVTEGQRIRFHRLAKGWRNMDLAVAAHLTQQDVTNVELDRRVPPWKRNRIYAALGMERS